MVISGVNILTEDGLVSTLNLNTISVPSEDRFTESTVGVVLGNESHLSTVTDSVNRNTVHQNIGHNRNRVHNDGNLVIIPASGVGLDDHDTIGVGTDGINRGRVGGLISTRDEVTVSNSIGVNHVSVINIVVNLAHNILESDLIPLIDNVLSIVVNEVGSQRDLTARADCSIRGSNRHNGLRIDIHIELTGHRSAAVLNISTLNIDRVDVGFVARIHILSIESAVTEAISLVVSDLTGLVPSEVQVTNREGGSVNIGNQEDGVSLTDMLVARDHNNRIRVNRNSGGRDRQRGATSLRAGHNSSIDIVLDVVIDGTRSIIDGSGSSAGHQDTVTIPSVNFTINIAIGRSGRNSQLGTGADIVQGSGHSSNNRIRIHSDNESIGSSVAEGSQLINTNRVLVNTQFRNKCIAQTSCIVHRIVIVVPTIGKLISIPVNKISRKGNLTTNANVILGNGNLHNRSSIHINKGFASGGTSVVVHNLNGKAVGIISVVLMEGNRVLRGVGNLNIVDNKRVVVLHPVESHVRTNRGRIHIGNQGNIVLSLTAYDRIGGQHQNRIRVNRDGLETIVNIGLTTGSRLCDRHRVVVGGGLTVKCAHNLTVGGLVGTFDDLAVAIPSVNLTASDTAFNRSRQVNLITVTNRVLSSLVIDNNRRIIVNNNSNRIGSGMTERSQLIDLDSVFVNTSSRNNTVSKIGSIRNRSVTIIPSVGELISIPISKLSSKSNLSANTNGILCDRDIHNRLSIDIDEGAALSITTVFIHEFNAEAVRIVSVISMERNRILLSDREHSIVFHPLVGNRSRRSGINISKQRDVVASSVTDDRIGDKLHDRVRIDRDVRKRVKNLRLTTGSALLHRNCIVIDSGFTVNRDRIVSENALVEAHNLLTVAVPSVNLTTGNTTFDNASDNADRLALTNRGLVRSKELSVENRDRVHINVEGVIRDTEILCEREDRQVFGHHDIIGGRSGIESLNLVGSARNLVIVTEMILIPLEDNQRLMIVIKIATERNLTTLANSIGIASDIHFGFIPNIDIERIRHGGTTITIRNFNSENQRIIVSGSPNLGIGVISTKSVRSIVTAFKPIIGGIQIIITVNPSQQ